MKIPKRRPETAPDPKRNDKLAAFDRLLTIMDELRENCPWDKKQSFESLRHLTIEETYELSDAILERNLMEIRKELGDLLLHIVFYARLGHEEKSFDIADVIHGVCDKLIHRHPHIYDDVKADSEEQVKANWEQIKLKEKQDASVLGGVPGSLPALVKAMRIQEKARGAGFDWDEKEQVWEKVEEEIAEFKKETDAVKRTDEFGDVLFSLINYARFVDINPEEALERTNKKFIKRFNYIEQASRKDGKSLKEMSLEEMNAYWEESKQS
jgi:XTP/dITP diphosphohydrolase